MQNLQVLDFIWAWMLFLTSHQFSRWHSSLCDSMCTWRCLCQNLPFLHITASMACLGGFPESWKGRETATLSLKGKTQQDSGTELPFVPLKIPSKVPAKAGYTSQTCPHTGTAVPGTFAPLTTINLFAKHQLPAPASPLVAASTSPPSSKAAPCHSSPLLTGASRTKSCPSKAYPAAAPAVLPQQWWHWWPLGSCQAPRGHGRGVWAHFTCKKPAAERRPTAGLRKLLLLAKSTWSP